MEKGFPAGIFIFLWVRRDFPETQSKAKYFHIFIYPMATLLQFLVLTSDSE